MVELTWDGKYDKNGKRAAPLRLRLPFQTVETVNESVQQRQMALDMFSAGRPSDWRNRLIWGDKRYVLPALLDEFAGKVDLIYIDPPFATGSDFTFQIEIETEKFTKQPSVVEQKAYRDTWGNGLSSYLQWFYETVILLRELLSDTGSLYVHLDWRVIHSAKLVLDEIFGENAFRNEITWKRSAIATGVKTQWRNSHDTILFYTKTDKSVFNVQYGEYTESSKNHYNKEDERGVFRTVPVMASGKTDGVSGQPWRGVDVSSRGRSGMHWLKNPETLNQLDTEGKIYWNSEGVPELKYYLDEAKGVYVSDFWDDITVINSMAIESVGYPTQKPEALLQRIINATTNEGDLVLDCFCGSGTTAAVAEKLGRRWITCDLGRFAIHTARKRLLSIEGVKPFEVQNLGKYERQAWQKDEFGKAKDEGRRMKDEEGKTLLAYRKFILELYKARPITGYAWLHGLRDGRMVHIGAVDSPVSPNDVKQIAIEFHKATGTGKDAPSVAAVDVLGWDFAFELNEVAKMQASEAGINMRFIRIPREILEKKAVEQGDIKFFELAALTIDVRLPKSPKTSEVCLEITDFTIPPDDVPAEVQQAIRHFSQWIDYWAVDWENKGDTFHNQWQAYRTRQTKTLTLKASRVYEQPGEYTVMVKVIDILGNDTTKVLKVNVG